MQQFKINFTKPSLITQQQKAYMKELTALKKNMGLTTWKNAPEGKILKSDTDVAKNYLSEKEIRELNRIVNMYLDHTKNHATRHKLMSMEDWVSRLDKF